MNKQKNVPELRFPEFEGDWNEFKLSKLISLISGQHLTPNEYSIKNGEVPYFTGPSDFTNDSSKIKKWTVSSDKYAQKGDILITVKGNGVGEMLFLELPRVIMGRQLMAIRPVKAVGEIIYQFLFTHKQQLQALASGNVIPGLSRSDILNIKIHFSTLEEQEKISNFLSEVDKKLTQLRRKKELLETYKSGLMQKLFSQQIRFKQDDGSAFPDWQEKKLKDIFQITRGQVLAMPKTTTKITENNIYPVYSSQTKNNGLAGYYNEYLFENAITWTTDGANAGETRYRSGKFYCTNVCGILLNLEGYANTFMAELINSVSRKYVSYVGNPKLMNNVMATIKLEIPLVKEQQKIADCLTALDKKIEAVAQKIHHTEQFKKGLLQKMFV